MKSANWIRALAVTALLASACGSSSSSARVSLPVPKPGEVTFYLSLPSSTTGLGEAAMEAATRAAEESGWDLEVVDVRMDRAQRGPRLVLKQYLRFRR